MNDRVTGTGILFVVSAPSGTGKSTVCRGVRDSLSGLGFSVSYTTRAPRDDERDGEHYHFVDHAKFQGMIDQQAFLEWADVFEEKYGTGLEATRQALAPDDLLLDIDVEGARQVREGPIPSVSVMMLPPDYETLERRLRGRGSESEQTLRGRLAQARREAEDYVHFDYVVVNDKIDQTVSDLRAIVRAERQRSVRRGDRVRRIIDTFPATPRGQES